MAKKSTGLEDLFKRTEAPAEGDPDYSRLDEGRIQATGVGLREGELQFLTEIGEQLGVRLRDATLAIYARAEQIARERGIILADTKLEFGLRADGTLVLGDEVLTPDSSRFWDAQEWSRGKLASFDKQYLRDWLVHESGWDRTTDTPPPALPPEIVAKTRERYLTAFQRLTGRELKLG